MRDLATALLMPLSHKLPSRDNVISNASPHWLAVNPTLGLDVSPQSEQLHIDPHTKADIVSQSRVIRANGSRLYLLLSVVAVEQVCNQKRKDRNLGGRFRTIGMNVVKEIPARRPS